MSRLPHHYPFELIDRMEPGRALLQLSHSSRWCSSDGHWPPILLAELLAQAALVLLSSESAPDASADASADNATHGYLAAMDGAHWSEELLSRPLLAGDTVVAAVQRSASLGRIIKVQGEILRDERKIFEAGLMLARG